MEVSHPNATARAGIVLTLIVAALAFASLNRVNPPFPITDDGVRDQLFARDCVELGHCHQVGASASVRGLHHGAAWIDLLTAVRLGGGDETEARRLVLILLAASVAILFRVAWRWLHPAAALPAALVLLGALCVDEYPSQLINPSTSVFADVLSATALFCYGLSGRGRYLAVAAFAIAFAVSTHVGSLSQLPALLAVGGLASSRPGRRLALATALFMVAYFAISRSALVANLAGLDQRSLLAPMVFGGLAVAFMSARLSSWFRRLSYRNRTLVIAGVLAAPGGVGLLWLGLWERHPIGVSYLHPLLAPIALAVGAGVTRGLALVRRAESFWAWAPSIVALVLLALLVLAPSRELTAELWTAADARLIAEAASKRGWDYRDLQFHLQSQACRELLIGMALVAPAPSGRMGDDARHLQVVAVAPEEVATLSGTSSALRLASGKVALLREIESWMRPSALVACVKPQSDTAPVCMPANRAPSDIVSPEQFMFVSWAFPAIHRLEIPLPYVAAYEIPLVSDAPGERDLVLLGESQRGACGWRVTHVEGLPTDTTLPAAGVHLRVDAAMTGRLVVEKPFATAQCPGDVVDRRYPPCLFESVPGDPLRRFAEGH